MNTLYFDGSSGISGDMILGALLDLGVEPDSFTKAMAETGLPVRIDVRDVKKASLRGLKVDVRVEVVDKVVRRWADVEALIQDLPFHERIKLRALNIFRRLFEAEARVHGRPFETTHLHEAGADDAIVDIVGACWLADALEADTFFCTPLNVGEGWIKSAHGVLPVPPPAVAELLKGRTVYSAWIRHELVTPTGAAIVSTLVDKFEPFPEICYDKIGYGAGTRDFPDFPNILRVYLGRTDSLTASKAHYQIEVNIDDANPQILAGFLDTALSLGAKDVSLTPVVMKKNRLGTQLTILTELDKMDGLIRAVFRETPSIGLRYFPVERRVLEREIKKITVLGEEIDIKIAYFEGHAVNVQPEFDDCRRAASQSGQPLKRIMEMALAEYFSQAPDKTGSES